MSIAEYTQAEADWLILQDTVAAYEGEMFEVLGRYRPGFSSRASMQRHWARGLNRSGTEFEPKQIFPSVLIVSSWRVRSETVEWRAFAATMSMTALTAIIAFAALHLRKYHRDIFIPIGTMNAL